MLYEKTKHIKIDCHYAREKLDVGDMQTKYVPSYAPLTYFFTKQLPVKQYYKLLHNIGATSTT